MRGLFAEKHVNLSNMPSFRAEHFPYSGPYPWLDRDDALERISTRLADGEITAVQANQCRHWAEDGYIVLEGLIEEPVLDNVWTRYEDAIRAGRIKLDSEPAAAGDPHPGRYLNPHKRVGAFCSLLKHPQLLDWLKLLTDRPPKPLQTIASYKGTQQAVHSDSIHMTTYPLGYLTAAWIAFEDIHPDCGPLVYYPGSHKLPYVFSREVGIAENEFRDAGYRAYQQKYEPFIAGSIEKAGLQPAHFHARKGDVLIWHANLLHGGSMRRDLQRSRRAVVCHFFVRGAYVYHDLAASRSRQQYMSTCLLQDNIGKLQRWRRK
ncbi:MAG: phytanoyl-CoA dioxygenase family protein [Bryobacteraceae bacterium]